MHRVVGNALMNSGSAAGIDDPVQVNGSDRGVLARQPQLPSGSPDSIFPPISGLIADGVTPLLFRVTAGDDLRDQVTYDVQLKVSNSLGGASCPDLNGRLRVLQNGNWVQSSKVTLSPQQPEAYLILQPVGTSEIKSNTALPLPDSASGMVQFILSLSLDGANRYDAEIKFGVRKPPVVLVHGFNSDSSAWGSWFTRTLMIDRGNSFVVAVNYGVDNDKGKDHRSDENTYGNLDSLTETLRKALAKQVESRDGTALWPADKWAWTRYDAVGHSQGGVLLRLLCSSSTSTSCMPYPFRNPENYFRGRFQRLVTVGAPHFGSTLGHLGRFLIDANIPFNDGVIEEHLKGAPADKLLQPKFRVDQGVSGKPTPQMLNGLFVPDQSAKIHMLGATIYGGKAPGQDSPGIYRALYLGSSDMWDTSIALDGTDGVVDLRSQLARSHDELLHPSLRNSSRMPESQNIAHCSYDLMFWNETFTWEPLKDLFGLSPVDGTKAVETGSSSVAVRVRDLLNGPGDVFGPFPTADQCAPLHAEMNATAEVIRLMVLQIALSQMQAGSICHSVAPSQAPQLPGRAPRSPVSTPRTVNMVLQPPTGESPNGAVTWLVVIYGPNGKTTDGVTLTPTGTYGENLQIDLAASVVGDVVVSVQFPSTSGKTVIGKPGVVASHPTGTLTGIEVRPDTVTLSAGPSVPLEIWGVYDDSSKSLLFTNSDNLTFGSGDEAVATVDEEGKVTLVAPGTTTVQVTYNGSNVAAATIHVLAPAPVITSPVAAIGNAGQTFNYQITADGAPTTFSAEGLPDGLAVDPATGLVSGSPAFEGLFHFTVGASNSDGQEGFQQVELTVTGTNQAPTAIGLDTISVPALQAAGAVVGHLATADVNPLDTFTYELVSGAGDADNSLFSISGGVLLTTALVDPATKPQCTIRLRSTDNGGLSIEQQIVLAVLGAPQITDPPTDGIVFSSRTFVLAVDATGREPLAFQWQESGVDIPGATSKTLELVGGMPGSSAFTVRVSNEFGDVTSTPATITVSPLSFGAWAAPYTLPGTETILPEGDIAHDGYSNLLKFAFNANPLQPMGVALPVASLLHEPSGDVLSLTHRRLIGCTLEFHYEWSPDLSYWAPFTPTLDVMVPDVDGDGTTELIRASRPIGPDEPAGFLRLKVIDP